MQHQTRTRIILLFDRKTLQTLSNTIGKPNYFEKISLPKLEDIPCFREFFKEYLQKVWKVPNDQLEESFERWCQNLAVGKVWPEVRLAAVYGLWVRCNFKQYEMANMLNVSIRTIRRDIRKLEKQMSPWH